MRHFVHEHSRTECHVLKRYRRKLEQEQSGPAQTPPIRRSLDAR
jgi:hypothetical protein